MRSATAYNSRYTDVINDRKIYNSTDQNYEPVIVSWSDYYAFGMTMPGRNGGVGYRYGFQNQEKDDEIKGNGNSINYKYRMHDSRLGRFFTVDPLMSDYPQWTPYAFSGNQVIHMVELEGLEPAEPGNGHGDVAKDDKGDTYIWSPREDTERKEYDGYGWVFVGQESEIYPSEGTVAKVEVKKIQG